jgi:hypothetical protein
MYHNECGYVRKTILGGCMVSLYHYFERKVGPFVSISGLSIEEAMAIQSQLTTQFHVEYRSQQYYERRQYLEQYVRSLFMEKGGKPVLDVPYYMVIGECPFLTTWFEDSDYIKIPINEFDLQTISFTFGDTFPTFSPRVTDDMEYRKKVYFYDEIVPLIQKYGLPQNTWDETYESPCYVEVQVWSDIPIKYYRRI